MSLDSKQSINKSVFSSSDLSISQTSETVDIRNGVGYAAQIVWSGGTGTTGNVIVEGTNDDPNSSAPTYTVISTDAVAATSGDLMKNNYGAMYAFARVRWDRTGGTTGTISCKISVKY